MGFARLVGVPTFEEKSLCNDQAPTFDYTVSWILVSADFALHPEIEVADRRGYSPVRGRF